VTIESAGEGIDVRDDTPHEDRAGNACAVCGGREWSPLPNPGPFCMASDWRVIDEPLDRMACDACGVAWRRPMPPAFFERLYRLYAHPPGGPRESARQALYAGWIASQLSQTPRRIVDVGCGNGSLLLALRDVWPEVALAGCDPSEEGVAHGASHGLQLWRGGIGDASPPASADLIVSVNVIEHTADPLAFLIALGESLEPGGTIIVVCPDGGRPGVELLMADHVHSFTAAHLRTLIDRAGLVVTGHSIAPAALGEFQMVVACKNGVGTHFLRTVLPGAVPVSSRNESRPHFLRRQYLHAWRELHGRLRARISDRVVCFGVGETAGLLRAYAPSVWTSVTACTADDEIESPFEGVPARRLADLSPDEQILLAVRPADQPAMAERLRASFRRVATWYDLVDVS
jgi:SAM-dependent methyltransferase